MTDGLCVPDRRNGWTQDVLAGDEAAKKEALMKLYREGVVWTDDPGSEDED